MWEQQAFPPKYKEKRDLNIHYKLKLTMYSKICSEYRSLLNFTT